MQNLFENIKRFRDPGILTYSTAPQVELIKARGIARCEILLMICLLYIIHTSTNSYRLLFLRFLKFVGVSPVIFLNWFERCATLL
jgi:hypothetical protein